MKTSKTFFLGVGGAKCGTTWLFNYLRSHPQFATHRIKELHTFTFPEQPTYLHVIVRLPWHRFAGRGWLRDNLFKAWLRSDRSRYFRLFETLLSPEGIRSTGEISPSYMQLDAAELAGIVKGFADRNIRTVVGMLLRDPVDRLYSEQRYRLKSQNDNPYRPKSKLSPEDSIEALLAEPIEPLYASGLGTILETIAPEQRFVSLYENLFEQRKVDQLNSMLGLDLRPGEFGRRVNATAEQTPLPSELVVRLARHLAPDYAAAVAYFGHDHIARYWPHLGLSGV